MFDEGEQQVMCY